MRRAALSIGCIDLVLSARIDSNWLEGLGFESVLGLNFLRGTIDQMAERHGHGRERGRGDGENGSSSKADIVTLTWDYGDCLLIPLAYRTSDLVINKGDLDCVMCSSDQIESRMNIYRDKVESFLRLCDLEDEDSNSNIN